MVRNIEEENIEMSHHRMYDNPLTRSLQNQHSGDNSYSSLSASTPTAAYNYYDVTHSFPEQPGFCDVKSELYDGASSSSRVRTQTRQYREDPSQADSPTEELQLSTLSGGGPTSWDQRDLCGTRCPQTSAQFTDGVSYRPSWYPLSPTAEMAAMTGLSSAQRDWLQKREIVSSELIPYADLTSSASFPRCNPFQSAGYCKTLMDGVFHASSSLVHGDSRPSSWSNTVQVGYPYQSSLTTSSATCVDFGITSSMAATDIRCQAISTSLTGRQDRGFLLAGGHVTEHAGQLPLSRMLKTEPRSGDTAGSAVAAERSGTNQKDSKTAPVQRVTASTSTGKTRTKDKYRTVYSEPQKAELEKQYIQSTYISAQRKTDISRSICLSERQVKIWFQNRRAKDRKYKRRQPQRSQRSGGGLGTAGAVLGDHARGGVRRVPSSGMDQSRCGAGVVSSNVTSTASLLSSVRAFEQQQQQQQQHQHPGVVALSVMNVVNGGGYPRQLRLGQL